jgi:hypothetical protein
MYPMEMEMECMKGRYWWKDKVKEDVKLHGILKLGFRFWDELQWKLLYNS